MLHDSVSDARLVAMTPEGSNSDFESLSCALNLLFLIAFSVHKTCAQFGTFHPTLLAGKVIIFAPLPLRFLKMAALFAFSEHNLITL